MILDKKAKDDRTEGWLSWHQVTGGPVLGALEFNSEAELMNKQPDLASEWKGRVLLNITLFDVEEPEHKMMKINEEIRVRATRELFLTPVNCFQI